MSWRKQEQCWLKAEVRADTAKQKREEFYVALQYAASFHCPAEQWKDCEELKAEREVEFCRQEE